MRYHATPEEIEADPTLEDASLLIEKTTRGAVYETDSKGFPTDERLKTAFRDATKAQARFWAAHGVNPELGAAGTDMVVTSESQDGLSISYGVDKAVLTAKANLFETVSPKSMGILRQSGLLRKVAYLRW